MNLEKLSKPELLTLFSILEGELEARDLVIEALKAQHRDTFIEERYGKYNISDPLMALQRDFETLKEKNEGEKQPVCTNPLSILKVVMKQCKNMQERMLSQLAAAESRHRKVILDLEEERQRHAQDTAEGDDVTYMLEKERERLTQQQLARNTVTQVLSRFTSQQGPIKPVSPNSSPFGTDYRNLANTASPRGDTSHSPTPGKVSSPLSPLSPGIKSPTIPRAERGNPPPIPPKKPGLTPSSSAATPLTKTHSPASSLTTTEDLTSSCSSNVVANGKDVEILLPTSS
uniref:CTTNBP2 N-terminal like n=1 Tax=Molossus molossus TaxID=27622 RepID=A0A7J8CQ57_MOLMO|nr:CTTNBP2 N-terminal like [Molossus molossus]